MNWNDPADDDVNPGRVGERQSVRDELEARLRTRHIELSGDETDEQVVRLVEAVDRFDAAVIAAGGDRMTNDPASSRPDDPRFVVPTRRGDESTEGLIARINHAAEALRAD